MSSRGKARLTRMRGKPFPPQRRPAGSGCSLSSPVWLCWNVQPGGKEGNPHGNPRPLSVHQPSMAEKQTRHKVAFGVLQPNTPLSFWDPWEQGQHRCSLQRVGNRPPAPQLCFPPSGWGPTGPMERKQRNTVLNVHSSLPCSLCEGVGSVNICKSGVRHGHHPFGS